MNELQNKLGDFFFEKKFPPAGFEPATSRTTVPRSNQLSYEGKYMLEEALFRHLFQIQSYGFADLIIFHIDMKKTMYIKKKLIKSCYSIKQDEHKVID